jgi:SAM-dependent methyltransferase
LSVVPDVWAGGAAYEQFIGRWSWLVAEEFVEWLGASPGRHWLDVGCGTGTVAGALLARLDPMRVACLDPSSPYLEQARRRLAGSRARFVVGEARRLPLRRGTFDGVVSGLVVNFVPPPEAALAEMVRVAQPGGLVAAYVWDYAGQMQLLRYFWDSAVALDPAAAELDEGLRFPICRPDRLEALFSRAGLRHVESRPIDVPTRFRDFDDYWSPFLGGQGPAPG